MKKAWLTEQNSVSAMLAAVLHPQHQDVPRIMPIIDSLEAAGIVAGRIIKALTEPFDLSGRQGQVSASIGISLLPAQADNANQLLHNADVAMYHAKRQGKANFQFYAPDLEAHVQVKDRTAG